MSARLKHRRARTAFTLVELMVALTVGGIVISAMYSMGASSARSFQAQHQIASMQSSLRFGYMQLKRDIMRAGLFGVPITRPTDPNGTNGVCNPSPYPVGLPGGQGWYAAVSSFRDELMPNVVDPTGGLNPMSPAGARGFSRDEVTLIGNYATASEYKGLQQVFADRVSLDLMPTEMSQALQNDFGWDANGRATSVLNAAELARAFPVGGLIRLASKNGDRFHLATLTAAPAIGLNTVMFSFTPNISGCDPDDFRLGRIAPLRVIRYGVELSAPGSFDTDRATGAQFAQLVRATLQPTAMATVVESRPILDYVATFNLAFTASRPVPGDPHDYTIGQRVSAAEVNNLPEDLRSVEIELGVRAPDVDRGMPWPCPPQACMALYPNTVVGSPTARVRVLRSEVLLPNLAYTGALPPP